MRNSVLITGANRGIGLALARHYAALDWEVVATARQPDAAGELQALPAGSARVEIVQLDLTSPASRQALAEWLAGRPLDILLHNAALLGDPAPQEFGRLDYSLFHDSLETNLVGPIHLSELLLDNLQQGRQRKLVFLGSAAGSHGLLGPGLKLYAYRASKAALHFAVHELAGDLASRGITVGLLNPGLVDTQGVLDRAPGEPVPRAFQPLLPLIESGELELLRPAEAAARIATLIASLGPEQAGRFINVDGSELPW